MPRRRAASGRSSRATGGPGTWRSVEIAFAVFEGRIRRFEVARIGQAVAADRAQVRQAHERAEVLADVTARFAVRQRDAEADATRDQRDLLRFDVQHAEFGFDVQATLLRHDQELRIGVVEEAIHHVAVGRIQVDAHAVLPRGGSVAGHREEAFDEVRLRRRDRQRAPAQLVRRHRTTAEIVVEARLFKCLERTMHRRRPHPIQPAAPILAARRGERRAAHLLGIQPVRHALRRVAADGQGPCDSFGGEFVGETRLVTGRLHVVPSTCVVYSTPRRIWSRSMLSNSAWKLPSPKPSLPLRWMISKKIGPIAFWVKICSSLRCLVSGSASIRILLRARRGTSSPWFGTRWSITSKYVSGVSRNSTPCARIASTVS